MPMLSGEEIRKCVPTGDSMFHLMRERHKVSWPVLAAWLFGE